MEHLGQRELAPSASEFWTATASPATAPLVEQACAAIDAGLAEYGLALKKFEDSLRHAFRRPLNVDDVERAMLIEALDAASEEARERMERCYPDRSPLDKLGARWQGKLRRAARRSQLRTTLMSTVAQAEMAAQVAEMKLLDEPPWLHGDRLLTAFELAHADIRTHLLDGLDRISVVVPRLALSE